MATVVDLLRKLGKRGAGDSAFAGPVVLQGAPAGAAAADAASLAQAGARSSIALLGHGAPAHAFLATTVATRLRAQPEAVALWIVPEHQASSAAIRSAAREAGIDMLDAGVATRVNPAQLTLATPRQLHQHMLRVHDRAWRWLWPRLAFVALPELHTYAGAPAAHLRWLLRRMVRLRTEAGAADAPVLAASMAPVANAEQAIGMYTDHGKLVQGRVRLLRLDDRPPHATLVALWRCGPDRETELERLAAELAAHQLQADVLDASGALAGARSPIVPAAHVAIAPRVPSSAAERLTLLRRGYRLLVLLAGDEPHELFFAAHADQLAEGEVVFPDSSENPYIAAPHLCCAAAELPLVDTELDSWGAVELRERLAKRGALQPLPGEQAWHAAADPPDPYEELDPRAIGGEPYSIVGPDGRVLSIVPSLLVERAAREGAVVAPGVRVRAVDAAARSVTVGTDATALASVVASSCEVIVRDQLAARPLEQLGVDVTRGRVTITQRLLGLRDLQSDGTQRRVSIQPPHEMHWSAAACWLKLPLPDGASLSDPATVGWSLAFAAPLLILTTPQALTAAYDEERRILYLVETEPGGTGVAAACYELFEKLLVYARDITASCARRPAWARLADSETELFTALKGSQRSAPAKTPPGSARVYSQRRDDVDKPATASAGAGQPDETGEPAGRRILQFPSRAVRESEAVDRVAEAGAARRRPAIYDTPQPAVARVGEQTESAVPAEGPTSADIATQGLLEELLGQASAAPTESGTSAKGGDVQAEPEPTAVDATPARGHERRAPPASTAAGQNGAGEQRKPDVKALIERMRRLREEREAQQRDARARQAELAARLLPPIEPDTSEPRFHIGQRVQCLPYGTGVVLSSRRADERELVLIDFPDYGEIEVDSSVSLMRQLDDSTQAEDD